MLTCGHDNTKPAQVSPGVHIEICPECASRLYRDYKRQELLERLGRRGNCIAGLNKIGYGISS